jgi:hypothetical protein
MLKDFLALFFIGGIAGNAFQLASTGSSNTQQPAVPCESYAALYGHTKAFLLTVSLLCGFLLVFSTAVMEYADACVTCMVLRALRTVHRATLLLQVTAQDRTGYFCWCCGIIQDYIH